MGVVAAGVPAAIMDLAAARFVFSRALDPPLLWMLLATVLAWLAGVIFFVAIVLACFRSTRAAGLGYMVGAATGTVLGVIGFAAVFVVAALLNVIAGVAGAMTD